MTIARDSYYTCHASWQVTASPWLTGKIQANRSILTLKGVSSGVSEPEHSELSIRGGS